MQNNYNQPLYSKYGFATYKELLCSDLWKKIKSQHYKGKCNSFCMFCGCRTSLEVHHIRYKRIGGSLATLCREHHQMVHDISREFPRLNLKRCMNKAKTRYKKAHGKLAITLYNQTNLAGIEIESNPFY